ncbi:MAG: hypothetical protein ACE1Y1_07550, partial [Nitrosomonadaceae bacterium]
MAKANMQARILAKIKTKAKTKSGISPARLVKHRVEKIKGKTKKEIKKTSRTLLKTVVKKHSRVVVTEKKPARKIANEPRKAIATNRERTGIGTSLAIHDQGLSTVISPTNRDATGQPLSNSMKKTLKRLRIWDSRSQN